MSSRAEFEQAFEELKRVICEVLAEKSFCLLSQGERQQVLIARTRMAGPTLLGLDEPCAGMDPRVRERFLAWLAERLSDRTFPTVLFSTHHMEEIVPGMERAICLRTGRKLSPGTTATVPCRKAIGGELYGTPVTCVHYCAGRYRLVWVSEE